MHASPAFMFSIKVVCNIFAFIQCVNKNLLEIWESIVIVHLFFSLLLEQYDISYVSFSIEQKKNLFLLERDAEKAILMIRMKSFFFALALSLSLSIMLIARPHFCTCAKCIHILFSLSLSLFFCKLMITLCNFRQ
jgi:hypothetical protein